MAGEGARRRIAVIGNGIIGHGIAEIFAGGGWQNIGNSAGFGNLNDGQHLFWTGDLSGKGQVQVLFYDAIDSNWWLGTITP